MARNLLTNASFEDGTGDVFTGWSRFADGSASYDEETVDVHHGSRCFKMTTNSSDACYLYQDCGCEVGQEYTVTFWAKRVSGNANFYLYGPFLTGNIPITSEWQRFSYTGICTATQYQHMHFNRNTSTGVLLIDKVRLEPTPVKYAIITRELSNDIATPDTDFFVDGFGTPKAAIAFSTGSEFNNNPFVYMYASMGFFDGTNQYCATGGILGGSDTSQNLRGQRNDSIAMFGIQSTFGYLARYSASTVANSGITVTMDVDNTSHERYLTVIMFAGHDVESHVGYFNTNTEKKFEECGFRPDVMFCTSSDLPAVSDGSHNWVSWNVGAATRLPQSDSYLDRQRGVLLTDSPGLDTINCSTRIKKNIHYSWAVALEQFTASGIITDTTYDTGGDVDGCLFLKIPGINVNISTVTVPGYTGTQSITGLGFKPSLVFNMMTNVDTFGSTTEHIQFSMGASDNTTENVHSTWAVDNVDVSNCGCAYHGSYFVRMPSASGHAYSLATVDSFDTDGYTLNWSSVQAAHSGFLGFTVAFQDATASKRNFGTSAGRLMVKQ